MEKKKNWIIALIIIIILLIIFILYLLFGKQKSFTITFNTDGGTSISNIEVKNNEIVELPDSPTKEGYKFVGWTNDEGNIIIKGTKVTKDLVLKANWIKNDVETVIVTFNTDNGNEMDSIIIEKGKIIILPVVPIKDGYIFVGWLDGNGNFITNESVKGFIREVITKEKTIQQTQQAQQTKSSEPVRSQVNDTPKKSESFSQRSKSEIQVHQQIKEKNQAIKQQKAQKQQLNKPKVKTLSAPSSQGNGSSSNKGYTNIILLSLIVSFVCGALFMVVYMIIGR